MSIAGFPDNVDVFTNEDIVGMEGFVDELELFLDASGCLLEASAFSIGNAIVKIPVRSRVVEIDMDTVAQMFIGGSGKRFGFELGVAIGVAD